MRAAVPLATAVILLAPGARAQIGSQGEALSFALRWCSQCHSAPEPEADLDLIGLLGRRIVDDHLDVLVDMKEQLAAGDMPPEGEPQPPREAIDAAISWADDLVRSMSTGPGRVTVRRLSRTEYDRTISDLFGVTTELSQNFPPDDLGYGFDNIGDAVSFSTLHLEKYAAAAADIANNTIVVEDADNPPVLHFEAEAMQCSLRRSYRAGGFGVLVSNGAFLARTDLPRAGEYIIRARACAEQAGGDLARMAFRADRRTLKTVEVPQTKREPGIHELRATLAAGPQVVSVAFTNDYYRPENPDPKNRDRNLLVDWVEIIGPVDAAPLSRGHRWLLADSDERAIVTRMIDRVWRRPAQSTEVERLADLMREVVDAGEPLESGARLALQAALVSPHFLFRVEPDTAAPTGEIEDLSSYALASRLSYFLWSSTPDEELLELARTNALSTPDTLAAQARRLLADPRASALAENFAGLWLELRRLSEVEPDATVFPSFTDELRDAMRRESELLFDSIVKDERAVLDLLHADYTFVNERLAAHYGIEGITGDHFRRVPVLDDRRRGVLGHASIHTITSHPTHTSPVRRGKWILDQLLDDPPPPPPPGNDAFREEEVGHLKTLREKLAVHRAKPECASCHDRMDPLGLALENFDPIGRWRDEEGGAAIDATGALPDGRAIDGPTELREVLGEGRAFVRCLLTKLFLYGIGREPDPGDRVALDTLSRELPGEPTVADLVVAIVRLDAFHRREMMR